MLRVAVPSNRITERRYALDRVLVDRLGCEYRFVVEERGDTEISMPAAGQGRVVLYDSLFASADWLLPASIPEGNPPRFDLQQAPVEIDIPEANVPIIFAEPKVDRCFIEERPDGIALRFDLLGAVFFLLTRYEEVALPDRDRHGRFPAHASLLGRSGLLMRPVADEYAEVLGACLRRLWPRLGRRRSSYRLNLTHDVDHPFAAIGRPWSKVVKNVAGDLLRRRDVGLASRRVWARTVQDIERVQDPNDTFDLLMDVSERHGCRSAFNFMTGDGKSLFDGDYNIDMPSIRALMRRMAGRGHEIGLHPSYATLGRRDLLEVEFNHLRSVTVEEGITQDAWGGRHHYLRWRVPESWQDWARVGLAHDSSAGFAERPGFRCGTCFEIPVFDLGEGRPLELRERPLIVMDVTLSGAGYLDLDAPAVLDVVIDLNRRVRHYGGTFTILWHNSSILTQSQQRLYGDVVEACVD